MGWLGGSRLWSLSGLWMWTAAAAGREAIRLTAPARLRAQRTVARLAPTWDRPWGRRNGAPRPRRRPCPTQGAVLTAGSIGQMALRRESRPRQPARPGELPLAALSPEPRTPHPHTAGSGTTVWSQPQRQQEATLKSHGASGGSRPDLCPGAARAPGGWAAAACRDTVVGGALGNNARASPPDAKGGVWGWPSLENSRMGEVRALDRPGWGRASRGPQHGPCADWLVGRGRGCWAGPPPVRKSPG